jgi:hydrogenase maturation protease
VADAARQRAIVIGVGNPDRGDDAAGRCVARRLAAMLADRVPVAELDGEATALVDVLGDAEFAIVVDACASGAPAGTVTRFDVSAAPLPARATTLSSHGFGLADAFELARALGRLPPCCLVYSIEGVDFAPGAPLSSAVARAVEAVADRILRDLAIGGSAPCTKPR